MPVPFTGDYPCTDVHREMMLPRIDLDPHTIKMVMISECPPSDRSDYFYEDTSGSFFQTTKTAFLDAGISVDTNRT